MDRVLPIDSVSQGYSRSLNSRLARKHLGGMDLGGNGGGLPVNNKQRAMTPNKSRGEFPRNSRKDSDVRTSSLCQLFLNIVFKIAVKGTRPVFLAN